MPRKKRNNQIKTKQEKVKITLKTKLLGLFLLTVILSILVFSTSTISLLSSVLEEKGMENIESDSELILSRINLWEIQNQSRLLRIADPYSEITKSFIRFQKNSNEADKKKIIEELEITLFNEPVFIEFFIMDKDTREILISTVPSMEGETGVEIKQPLETIKKSETSSIFFSERLNEYTLFTETTLKDEFGKVIGTIRASVNIHSLGNILFNKNLLGKTGEAYLVDYNGNAIIGMGRSVNHLNINKNRVNFVSSEIIAGPLKGESGVKKYLNYGQKEVFGYQTILPHLNSIFIYEKELSEVFEPIQSLSGKIRLLLIAMLIISMFFTFLLIYRLTKPIESLSKAAKEIAAGNYGVRAKIKSRDEIGLLAGKFNTMTDSLVSSLEQISLKNALLQSQYDTSLFGILAVGKNGEIMSYNKSFKDIWNFGSNIIGKKTYHELMEHILKQVKNPFDIIEEFSKLKSKNKKFNRKEILLKDDRVIEELSANLLSKTGKALGFIFYFQDITKEAEVNRAKTEFISLASHQLQTPLTSIKWSLESLMEMEKKDQKKYKIANDAYNSTERMIYLVSDLLNTSNLDAGLITPDAKELELGQFMEKQIQKIEVMAKAKKIDIEFKKPNKKIKLKIDEKLISNVILNIISNSILYSEPKKKITISLKVLSNNAEILIKDQGIGISKKDQERLFTKFFRTHKASKYNTNGTGLGLYISKKILTICKGKIKVISKLGKGSAFHILLPIRTMTLAKDKAEKELINLKYQDRES